MTNRCLIPVEFDRNLLVPKSDRTSVLHPHFPSPPTHRRIGPALARSVVGLARLGAVLSLPSAPLSRASFATRLEPSSTGPVDPYIRFLPLLVF